MAILCKILKFGVTSILLMGFFLFIYTVPGYCSSENKISKIIPLEENADDIGDNYPTLTIRNADDDWKEGDSVQSFSLILSEGYWNKEVEITAFDANGYTISNAIRNWSLDEDDSLLKIEFNALMIPDDGGIKIGMKVHFKEDIMDDVDVTVDCEDSMLTDGYYVFVRMVGDEGTLNKIESVRSFDSSITLDALTFDELAENSLSFEGAQSVTLRLPNGYSWGNSGSSLPVFTAQGSGFSTVCRAASAPDSDATKIGQGFSFVDGEKRTLRFSFYCDLHTGRGTISLTNLSIHANDGALAGDIYVKIEGDSIKKQELLIARHDDIGVNVTVTNPTILIAGQYSDQVTGNIKIQEKVPRSLLAGRNVYMTFPRGVKPYTDYDNFEDEDSDVVPEVDELKSTNTSISIEKDISYDEDKNRILFTVPKYDIDSRYNTQLVEFNCKVSIDPAFSGPINVDIEGAGISAASISVASVLPPVYVQAVTPVALRIGLQNQPAPDIVVSESKLGVIDPNMDMYGDSSDDSDYGLLDIKEMVLRLDQGVSFAAVPVVNLLQGDDTQIDRVKLSDDGRELHIYFIYSTVTKRSIPIKFAITNLYLSVDRQVPTGPLHLELGGGVIIKNYAKNAKLSDYVVFNNDYIIDEFAYGEIVTPVPGARTFSAVFMPDSAKFVLNKNEETLNVATCMGENGSLLVPVLALAKLAGIPDSRFLWNSEKGQLLFSLSGKTVMFTAGSDTALVDNVKYILSSPIYLKDEVVYCPLDSLSNIFSWVLNKEAEGASYLVEGVIAP